MYKTVERTTERFLKFLLFYLANEEIQSRKIQNSIYDFEFSHTGFPCSQDKRAGISIFSVVLYTVFLYILVYSFFWRGKYSIVMRVIPTGLVVLRLRFHLLLCLLMLRFTQWMSLKSFADSVFEEGLLCKSANHPF